MRALFLKKRFEGELNEEVRFHLDSMIDGNLNAGMSGEEARLTALRRFGAPDQAMEGCRDARVLRFLEALWRDMGFGVRMMRRGPGLTAVAVLTLAIGIGANSAIFSLIHAVLLQPEPYRDPDRLVIVRMLLPRSSAEGFGITPEDFRFYKEKNDVFEDIGAVWAPYSFTLAGIETPTVILCSRASANFFAVLGVKPFLGRMFIESEGKGASSSIPLILSYALWQRSFAGDDKVIGRAAKLNGNSYTVVGVLPSWFLPYKLNFMKQGMADAYEPLMEDIPKSRFANWDLTVIAHLKTGVSAAGAKAQLDVLTRNAEKDDPAWRHALGVRVIPLHDEMVGETRQPFLILAGAVALVLLIACANVANLLIAKAHERAREFAVRAALGAGRRRLVRQLLTESCVLSLLGGVLGLLLAVWIKNSLIALGPEGFPRLEQASIDIRVAGFTLILSLTTVFFFGLIPALRVSRVQLNEMLQSSSGSWAKGLARSHARNGLIVVEIALTVVLLVGAGLLIRSFWYLKRAPAGFKTEDLWTALIPRTGYRYHDEQQIQFYREVLERVRNLPGTRGVAATSSLMPRGYTTVSADSTDGSEAQKWPRSAGRAVSPGYFETMGIPIIMGRDFTNGDVKGNPEVIIVSESLARRAWPDKNAVGQRLTVNTSNPPAIMTVIGVVGDTRFSGSAPDYGGEIYTAYLQRMIAYFDGMTFVIRVTQPAAPIIQAFRKEIQALDSDQAIEKIDTVENLLSAPLATPRFYALVLGTFGAAALILAAVGIYGLLAHSVGQRTHEIGLRVALGAKSRDILIMVMGKASLLVAVGLTLGLLGAMAVSSILGSLLYGVTASDPATLAGTALVLAFVALLACFIPARRAASVDPMTALRHE